MNKDYNLNFIIHKAVTLKNVADINPSNIQLNETVWIYLNFEVI